MTGLLGGLSALAAGAAIAFKQFEDAEKLVAQTEAVIKSTGGVANVTAREVTDLATAIMEKTGIDDEAIRTGENLLLTFKNIRNEVGAGNDIFNQATQAVTDISVAMGQDFKSSALQLGKALNDPILGMTALRRVGVQFSEEQTRQIEQFIKHNNLLGAQKVILQELSSEFGGSAEAQKTASQTMATSLGELAETIGAALAPAITDLADLLTRLVSFIQDNVGPAFAEIAQRVTAAWDAVRPFAETIGNVLLPLFEAAWHAIRDRLIPALEKFEPLFKVIGIAVVAFATVLLAQVAIVITAISHVIDWIGKILEGFMKVVGWVRENLAEPIVGAIQKVITAIGNVVDWIKDRFLGAWNAIKAPVLAVIGSFVTAIQTLIGWIRSAINWLSQLGRGVGSALAERGIEAGIIDLPGAQTGGFVAQTGAAIIHRGETVVPAGMGFGGDIVLQVDGVTFARITRDQLRKLGNRNAGTGL